MPHKETDMTTITRTKLALTAMATAAVAIALPATANAGIPPSFQTPSGNIMCWIADDAAVCRIVDYTYSAQQQDCPSPGGPNGFWLKHGMPAKLDCSDNAPGTYTGMRTSVTLDYGQTKSVGVMTCASEPSGVTCTDTSTGHFFHVSRDSYELG
jgi:hypothetical protein